MPDLNKRIMLVGSFWNASIESFYHQAFVEIGSEVACFELEKQNGGKGGRTVRRASQFLYSKILGEAFIEHAREFDPDLILIFKGKHLAPETIENLRIISPRAVIANLNPDSPWDRANTSRRLRQCIPHYDLHFTWSRSLLPEFLANGAKRVEYLPFGYSPLFHNPTEHTFDNLVPDFDIAFVGTYDAVRESLLQELTDVKLLICGNGWEKSRLADRMNVSLHVGALYGADAMALYDNALCGLNILREQNANSHNMRTFELPASGHVMLTSRTVEQSEFFEESKEILCYSNVEELKEKVGWLRQNPELRRLMALNARTAARPFTYALRAQQILDQVFRTTVSNW